MMTRNTPTGTILIGTILMLASSSLMASPRGLLEPSTGIAVDVDSSGHYTITVQDPAWLFAGDVGAPLADIDVRQGTDTLGDFQEIVFTYSIDARATMSAPSIHQGRGFPPRSRQGGIRTYRDKPVVLFTITYLDDAANIAPFPSLASYPQNLFHLSYKEAGFAPYTFGQLGPDSPWLFFDANANAFMLSPASHFMVASTALGNSLELTSAIDRRIATLPSGFSYATLLVIGTGINRTFETWGRALTDLQGKSRPANDADLSLGYLGYWTDNGATYYYNFVGALGYEGTLLAVRDDFASSGLPLGYMQLDSWFYPKGPLADWRDRTRGIFEYVADQALFSNGLPAFQQQLGLPLVTHARWIDEESPYRQQYEISGNVAIDPAYWDAVGAYLQNAGVVTYEQDWLRGPALPLFNLHDWDAFLDEMARAAAENGLTMQYCLALPRHYLQSSKYDNITTIRVSDDRFERGKWNDFLYASRLASALGVWPWSDVFMSAETDNLLLATLSAGPVGVGDRIGSLNGANLFQSVRGDGVIVKPDAPLVPIDQSFVNDAASPDTPTAPMVASTYTDFVTSRAAYVFAYNRTADGTTATFTPASLNLAGPVFIYDYFRGSGVVADAADLFSQPLDHCTGTKCFAYDIVVPIGPSGIGFLGDVGQFVSLGRKRIAALKDDGTLEATVAFATGESSRTLYGYAASMPVVMAADGTTGDVAYDPETMLFTIEVAPGDDGMAVIDIVGA